MANTHADHHATIQPIFEGHCNKSHKHAQAISNGILQKKCYKCWSDNKEEEVDEDDAGNRCPGEILHNFSEKSFKLEKILEKNKSVFFSENNNENTVEEMSEIERQKNSISEKIEFVYQTELSGCNYMLIDKNKEMEKKYKLCEYNNVDANLNDICGTNKNAEKKMTTFKRDETQHLNKKNNKMIINDDTDLHKYEESEFDTNPISKATTKDIKVKTLKYYGDKKIYDDNFTHNPEQKSVISYETDKNFLSKLNNKSNNSILFDSNSNDENSGNFEQKLNDNYKYNSNICQKFFTSENDSTKHINIKVNDSKNLEKLYGKGKSLVGGSFESNHCKSHGDFSGYLEDTSNCSSSENSFSHLPNFQLSCVAHSHMDFPSINPQCSLSNCNSIETCSLIRKLPSNPNKIAFQKQDSQIVIPEQQDIKQNFNFIKNKQKSNEKVKKYEKGEEKFEDERKKISSENFENKHNKLKNFKIPFVFVKKDSIKTKVANLMMAEPSNENNHFVLTDQNINQDNLVNDQLANNGVQNIKNGELKNNQINKKNHVKYPQIVNDCRQQDS